MQSKKKNYLIRCHAHYNTVTLKYTTYKKCSTLQTYVRTASIKSKQYRSRHVGDQQRCQFHSQFDKWPKHCATTQIWTITHQKIHQTHGHYDEQHELFFKNAHQKDEHYMRNTVNSNEKEKLITRFKNASTHKIQKTTKTDKRTKLTRPDNRFRRNW